MDNKDLITRFAEDCFRFEALHQEIDGLIADADSEVLAYEYEDLANQAAEIVLKLSANGNNLGLNFYRYYVERLEYIIDYFRALLEYEEIPIAEDEPNELDDEPAAEVRFEGDPADCVFQLPPPFVYKKWELQSPPMTKDEANAAESDEAADDPAAGAPISEADILLPPGVVPITENVTRCWEELTSKERAAVRETFAMWGEMNEITGRHRGGDYAEAVKELDDAKCLFSNVRYLLIKGYPLSLIHNEQNLRKRINKAIDAIPGFRDSEKFKELIELYPTYKEIEQ